MWKILKKAAKWISPPISSDERQVLLLIAGRLPVSIGEAMRAQVEQSARAFVGKDQKSITYKVGTIPSHQLLPSTPSSVPSAEIHVAMFGRIQPFRLHTKSGLIDTLELLEPYPAFEALEEFAVVAFSSAWVG